MEKHDISCSGGDTFISGRHIRLYGYIRFAKMIQIFFMIASSIPDIRQKLKALEILSSVLVFSPANRKIVRFPYCLNVGKNVFTPIL